MNLEEIALDGSQITGQLVKIKYASLDDLEGLMGEGKILFDQNPKKHDIGAIARSIKDNGFVDPPKWDSNLNNSEGGLVFGNGRMTTVIQVLRRMFIEQEEPPKGIGVEGATGKWFIPIKFGADADSEIAAKRFAIDHNNLTMAGGNFTAADMMKMWEDDSYLELAKELADADQLPITLDGDDLDLLIQLADSDFNDYQVEKIPEEPNDDETPVEYTGNGTGETQITIGYIRFSLPKDDYVKWHEQLTLDSGFTEPEKIEEIKKRLGMQQDEN